MTVNLEDLSADDRLALLQQLQEEELRARAERRAQDSLNRALRRRLVEVGVEHHAAWVQPISAACAYPVGWVVTHAGRKWVAQVTGASAEPSEDSPQWGPYDSYVEGDDVPEPSVEDLAGEALVGPTDDPVEAGDPEEMEESDDPEDTDADS